MNWRAIFAIVRKDLKLVARSRGVMIPLLIVPLVFLVVLPAGAILLFSNEDVVADSIQEMDIFLNNLPQSINNEMADLGYTEDTQRLVYLTVVYQLAPLYLILPLMMSSVIGADSFAGEKERKTLEALIYSPTTDGELYLGKMLSAWLPAVAVAIGGAVIYGLVVNTVGASIMGGPFFPNMMWLVLVLWVVPGVAGLGLAAMVLVSSRVRTFQEAYQLGSMVVLPVILLVVGQFAGVIYFDLTLVLLLGLVLWLIDGGLLYYGARTFQRSELIAQL